MAQVENTLVKPRADALYLGIAAQAADSVLLDGELSAHYHAWANLTGVPYDELIAVPLESPSAGCPPAYRLDS